MPTIPPQIPSQIVVKRTKPGPILGIRFVASAKNPATGRLVCAAAPFNYAITLETNCEDAFRLLCQKYDWHGTYFPSDTVSGNMTFTRLDRKIEV